jgi:hypothetical protein
VLFVEEHKLQHPLPSAFQLAEGNEPVPRPDLPAGVAEHSRRAVGDGIVPFEESEVTRVGAEVANLGLDGLASVPVHSVRVVAVHVLEI